MACVALAASAALCACALFTPVSGVADGPPDAAASETLPSSDTGTEPSSDAGALPDVDAGDAPGACPCSLFGNTPFVGDPAANDGNSVELGVRFTSEVAASVIAIRFYKGTAENTSPHVGSIWAAGGTRLFSGTFPNETPTGWQTLEVDPPLPIAARNEYVASYHANVGRYASTASYFVAGYDAPPLHASAANGVFSYDAPGTMPTNSNGSNYWVDVVITTP
jgi:hypothetical protein